MVLPMATAKRPLLFRTAQATLLLATLAQLGFDDAMVGAGSEMKAVHAAVAGGADAIADAISVKAKMIEAMSFMDTFLPRELQSSRGPNMQTMDASIIRMLGKASAGPALQTAAMG